MPKCSVDIATLVFVLSAVHPDKMLTVLQNVIQVKQETEVIAFFFFSNIILKVHPQSKQIINMALDWFFWVV